MKKFFLSVLFALLVGVAAFAEVDIPQEQRVHNFPSGCCVWCALEDLANIHGVTQLKGIAKYRHDNYSKVKTWVEGAYAINQWGQWVQIEGPHWSYVNEAPGTPERVLAEFKRLKVKHYWLQRHYNYDTAILKEAVDKDLGCAVGLRDYPKIGDYHMVTLTHLDDNEFIFIENRGKCSRYTASREWFDQHWTGYAILLYPERPATSEYREKVKPVVDEERIKE